MYLDRCGAFVPRQVRRRLSHRCVLNCQWFGIAATGPEAQDGLVSRRIVVVAYPEVQALDVVGPIEVFSVASRLAAKGRRRYPTEVGAGDDGPVLGSSGLRLIADTSYRDVSGVIDTLIVAGGEGVESAVLGGDLVDWVADT